MIPLPPLPQYATPGKRYFRMIWDTMDVPHQQERDGTVIITPQFDKLVIYGREVGSPYSEDQEGLTRAQARGRVMGEWFSVVCPDGEFGTNALAACEEISVEEFSAAYERGWT